MRPFAGGRVPATDKLGLENTDVQWMKKGLSLWTISNTTADSILRWAMSSKDWI